MTVVGGRSSVTRLRPFICGSHAMACCRPAAAAAAAAAGVISTLTPQDARTASPYDISQQMVAARRLFMKSWLDIFIIRPANLDRSRS